MEIEKQGDWSMEELYFSATEGSKRSSHAEGEDGDAIRLAVLEKLPTFERLQTAFWVSYDIENQQNDVQKQVNVRNLDAHAQQQIIETLFKVAEVDNGRILRKIRDRFDRFNCFLFSSLAIFKHSSKHVFFQNKCMIS